MLTKRPEHEFIQIEDLIVPCPFKGVKFRTATIVDSGRNANAVVVGQKIGRDQYKIESLEWRYLDAYTWSRILQIFDEHFSVYVTFWNMVKNDWDSLMMYPGDRTAEPFNIDPETGKVISYINCKVNLIDMGMDSGSWIGQ